MLPLSSERSKPPRQARRPRALCLAASVGLGLQAVAGDANADPTPLTAPILTPPHVVEDPGVAYPAQALREGFRDTVTVTLVVEIDAEGRVTVATPTEAHSHGLDEAAREAAMHLRFEPATRNGAKVPSRIRYAYTLEPPAPAPVAWAADAPSAAASDPQEITVKGERAPREVTKRTVGREELEHSPGTKGDPLLALQNFPGIARPPPLSGALVVRGSAPQDTNVYVNGTNVPIIYHFGGLSSVIPTDLLDKVDFYPGNYGAAYGRGLGGVVDVGLRDPRKDGFHGLAQVDTLDARLRVEGPLFGGFRFLAAARRSWFDLLAAPALEATGVGVKTAPRYYDYELELLKDIDDHSSFRLAFFGSDDAVDLQSPSAGSTPSFAGEQASHTSFWRLQARYDNRLSDRTELHLTAAYGEDAIGLDFGTNHLHTTLHPFSLRGEVSQKVAAPLMVHLGLDLLYEPYDLSLQLPPPTQPGVPSGGPGLPPARDATSDHLFLPGAYAELEIVPWRRAHLVPGVRIDYDSATRGWDVAPRVSFRQDLADAPRTTLKGGVGIYDQPPTPFDTDPKLGTRGLTSSRSVQADVGVEQELGSHVELAVDGFYKWLYHGEGGSFGGATLATTGANTAQGYAYGVEWLLRYKPDARFFGWLSYTLSRSERRTDPGAPYTLFAFDQPHVLAAVASYKLDHGWQVGARFRLSSGNPYVPMGYGAYNATVGTQLGVAASSAYTQRLPLSSQLDLRVDKTWTLKRGGQVTFYVDVQNVYNATNPWAPAYNYNYTQNTYAGGLPILPTVGIKGEL
jgi:TonB family protein